VLVRQPPHPEAARGGRLEGGGIRPALAIYNAGDDEERGDGL